MRERRAQANSATQAPTRAGLRRAAETLSWRHHERVFLRGKVPANPLRAHAHRTHTWHIAAHAPFRAPPRPRGGAARPFPALLRFCLRLVGGRPFKGAVHTASKHQWPSHSQHTIPYARSLKRAAPRSRRAAAPNSDSISNRQAVTRRGRRRCRQKKVEGLALGR